jgi:splicing factor 3B subunit 2
MGLTTAERNRRKRERKKKEKQLRRKEEEEDQQTRDPESNENDHDIEIEYVVSTPDVLASSLDSNGATGVSKELKAVLQKFQERASIVTSSVVSDDEVRMKSEVAAGFMSREDEGWEGDLEKYSKRKLKEALRPTVADLKRRVQRPDLVEAHDVTAPNPEFLIQLKAVPGTVPVPRHWGRKRKYLQGKRGFEKPPFQLPDFIQKTGIAEVRDTVAEAEANMSVRQLNRQRVAPKMGAIDVDYRTLHSAFFQHQTKPSNLTKPGDLYYEGKELESRRTIQPGKPLSNQLRLALGMTSPTSPPPWLVNMQRYGPPPSYPSLPIPGLSAPLPNKDCQYGYHVGGWGKPPVDKYGRPLYGGNPFDLPGSTMENSGIPKEGLVTSDGKTLLADEWGSLPLGQEIAAEEGSDEEMQESSDEEQEEGDDEEKEDGEEDEQGHVSVLPTPKVAVPTELRKSADGTETPAPTNQLYTILEQQLPVPGQQQVFGSDVQYKVPAGAESVLSKVAANEPPTKKPKHTDKDEEDALDKNFKF